MTEIRRLTPLSADKEPCGTMVSLDGQTAQVLCKDGLVEAARIALGCIVRPAPGDRVLLADTEDGRFVLSVLDRPTDAPVCLMAEGDLHVGSARGSVHIDAATDATVTARGGLRLFSGVIESIAEHWLVRARRSSRFVAESDQSRCGDIDHRAAGSASMTADTVFVSATTLVRMDADQIHMG